MVGEILNKPIMNKIEIKLEKITPAMADEIIKEKGGDNYRGLRGSASRLYGNEMKEGRWMFNGDVIRFDWNGKLIDGQHRLEAIKKSGIPQDFIVVEGLNPECVQTIDIGYKRSPENYLEWYLKNQEKMYTKGATAVVKLALTLKRGNGQIGHSSAYSGISNTEIVDKYLDDSIHFNEAVSFGKEISKNSEKVLKPSHVGGLYYYLVYINGYDIGKVKKFFGELSSYKSDGKTTPFKTAYKILDDKDGKLGRSGTDIINTYKRCWNSFIKGCDVNLISADKCPTEFLNPKKTKSVAIETPVEVV